MTVPKGLRSLSEIAVFSGGAHTLLAAEICSHLQVPLLPAQIERYANDCLGVQLQANCRERDVFIIQPLVPPVQEHLVELLLMLDAARGASAARITVVMPHYAYARSDKKEAPRISIGGRDIIVLDDEIARGSTVIELLERPHEREARSVRIACTHGVFSAGALDRLNRQDDVLEIVSTNTVPIPAEKCVPKLKILSVAPALAEAMRRIHNGESVSALFHPVDGGGAA